jgi:hypothetical protein
VRRTALDTTGGGRRFASNVDELYRLELGLQAPGMWAGGATDATDSADGNGRRAGRGEAGAGWQRDSYRGLSRLALYGTAGGKRNAYVRLPERRLAVIILTDDDEVDTRTAAERIVDRLLSGAERN